MDLVNSQGGAIAIGHQLAAGLRLIGTVMHNLEENSGGNGLATLCIGGGQGGAVAVEVAS